MSIESAASAPLLPRFVTVGFVGKRKLPHGDTPLQATLERVFTHLEAEYPAPRHTLVGLSALALGADTVFADVCASRGVPQQVFLPTFQQEFFALADFNDSPELAARSKAALRRPNVLEMRITGTSDERDERFAETAFEIINESDVLVVACLRAEVTAALRAEDAEKPFARGGSAETLHHAWLNYERLIVVIVDELGSDGYLPIELHQSSRVLSSAATRHAAEVLGFGEPMSVFGPTSPVYAAITTEALLTLEQQADAVAQAQKQRVTRQGGFTLLAHVLATACAAIAVVFHPPGPWSATLALLKAGLLLASWWVIVHLHHRHEQHGWMAARLLAELARSARAFRPLMSTGIQFPLPWAPRHLRGFHLPEVAQFAKFLYLNHLREVRAYERTSDGYPIFTPALVRELAETYIHVRLEAFPGRPLEATPLAQQQASNDRQLTYFRRKSSGAKAKRRWFDRLFLYLTATAAMLATGAFLTAAVRHGLLGEGLQQVLITGVGAEAHGLELFFLKVLPLVLPVGAAAVIALIGMRDIDREADRFGGMVVALEDARDHLLQSQTIAQLSRRIERTEVVLLQEVVEWRAKMSATRHG